MKTLFAKYNSERLPKYQIVTKIVQDLNGKRHAVKEPMRDEAKEHIDTIFHNYELLKSRYSINLVQPAKQGDTVVFEMAEGVSLEKLMLQAIHDGNIALFERYVEKFVAYVDQFVSHKNVLFEPCDKFKAVFGEWTIDAPQDIIDVANIDLIFGNIFLHNDHFTLIDYEWVFESPMPKSYIVWRAFYIFSIYHDINISKYGIERFFKHQNEFIQIDEEFSSCVHGKNKEHFLNRKVLKANVPLNIHKNTPINQADDFIQLFLDNGNGITEENSMKLPVVQNADLQEFVFDLSDKPALTALRLDPLNDSCVIEIESCTLVTDQGETDLQQYIASNALIHHGNIYFFDHSDPQIYFNDFGLEKTKIKKLITTMRFPHVGKDAIQMCVKQTAIDKDHIIASKDAEHDQTKTELDQTKTELDQTKASISWKITKPLRKIKQMFKGN